MGIWEAITDLVEAAAPWSVAEAEAPAEEPQEVRMNELKLFLHPAPSVRSSSGNHLGCFVWADSIMRGITLPD